MGKKNKYAKNEGEKPSPQQPQPGAGSQPGPSGNPPQPGPQQGAQKKQGGSGQQGQGGQGPSQGAQRQQGQGPSQGAQRQQGQGPSQGAQRQQGQGPPQGGQTQQQGAWGSQGQGGQQRGPQAPSQGAQRQQGQGPPQGGQTQQQGGWGSQGQGGQQRGPQAPSQGAQRQQGQGPPQGGQTQQQGGWGSQGQGGQQRGPQGAQRQQGQGPSQGGQTQQQGAWGSQGQGGQQRGPQGPSQGGQTQQQGGWVQQGQGGQQRGPPQGQQRGPPQGQGGQQRGPPQGQGGQQRGPPQGQGGQQRGPPQGQRPQTSESSEKVVPTKPKSCAGIVRGTLGRSGSVEVNYLSIDIKNMPAKAYHYDVTITPDRPKKFLRTAFEQCKLEIFTQIESAFDGNKSCYTVKPLPVPIAHKVNIPDSGNRMKEFTVEIKETGDCVIDLNSLRTYHNESVSDKPMRAMQVLDVVMSGNNHERGIRVGRSFFKPPANPFDLEGGFEAWTGLYQAAILGECPLVNVDISHKSFPKSSTVIDYLIKENIRPEQGIDNRSFRDVQRFFKTLDIEYTPPPSFGATVKKYRVLDIGEPASKTRFKDGDGKEWTVVQYFQSKGCRLRYPDLNVLKVGSTVRSISLPMEFCSIPGGQALNRKDEGRQVQNMIKFAATSTNVRKEKIMDLLNFFKHNDSPIVRAFGIQIGSQFIKVPTRNLPAPLMEYLNGQTCSTFKGAWRMDGKLFLKTSQPPNGHKWAIIYEERSRVQHGELEYFKNDVVKTSKQLNMNLQENAEILRYREISKILYELAEKKCALVFVVLGNFGTSYAQVKQMAELQVGILTQCIKENTLRRTGRDKTVFSNILLKVNAKLNGTNHKISKEKDAQLLKLLEPIEKVMYMGADVTHPSPDQTHIPSVVGVAASHDAFGACYNMQYRLQQGKREDIEDMESVTIQHMKVYFQYQKSYPDKIIYYRDGVSDGQFPKIKDIEIRAIKKACTTLKINPKITCIIVVKRHHTRFFPMTQPRDNRDYNNVEPGTVVDQYITHPYEMQFFLVSHQSIQGTAKPTRYNVIMNESNFNIDLLQKLTYNLCHLFPRCNRVVSYPAPAYLAHLVAFRGRVYIEGSYKFSKNLKDEYQKRLIKPNLMISNPMYFV